MLLLCCAESVQVVLSMQLFMFRCYWVSQLLQQVKNCDLGDSSMRTRLQRRRQLCKLGTKERCNLPVKARPGIGNKIISTNFTVVMFKKNANASRPYEHPYHAPSLLSRKCTSGVVTEIVHISLLLGFTAAAAAEKNAISATAAC